ncbi:MAG: AAA family ATPase, partial [Coriobacteriia bacterium]|nr:AAA family ATPase [Coriobacteriia bacterium]
MAFTIALAGKGGTGKTTTAALVVRALRELGAGAVLAVDADPNSTLHEALGTDVDRSVGEITEEMMQSPEATPGGMSKDAWMEYNVQRYVVETREFDLLSMGRPEGAGCYCYANNLVRGCVDDLSRSYEYVVLDN